MVLTSEIVLMDCKRLNERFVREAMDEWDKEGGDISTSL